MKETSLLFAEVTRLLQAIELYLYLRVCSRGCQKSIFSNRSRTGILEGRSYDPGEALRAIQGTRPLLSAPFLPQVIHFDCLVYLRRTVEVGAVLRPQNIQGLLAHRVGRIQTRSGIADEDSGPQTKRIGLEIAVSGIEAIVLPPIGQGRAQRIATRLWKNIGSEKISDLHGLLTGCVARESFRHAESQEALVCN